MPRIVAYHDKSPKNKRNPKPSPIGFSFGFRKFGSPTKNTGNRLCFLLVAPSGAANPKGSRERSDAPPTRRRQGAMAVGALRLPPCPQRLPLLFPKISLRCDFWEPCFIACGVSATGGVKSDEISGKKPVFFCWSRRQAPRTCLAIAARIPKRTSVL